MHLRHRHSFTLIELVVVVIVLALLMAILLPAVQKVRKAAVLSRMGSDSYSVERPVTVPPPAAPARPLALVKSFSADVVLTPRLSVGTATPESIYEAQLTAKIQAAAPPKQDGECELELPLPPQISSLADVEVAAGGIPSEQVSLRAGKLVWRGTLTAESTQLKVAYTAVGKGLYELSVPPGGILDRFDVKLEAKGSDVRMLELSLQPTNLARVSGSTTYRWEYRRLLFGQPIRLDVLGIAPIDRLGELTWLGPLSVIVFGLLVGLFVQAFGVTSFDRWMLLLTVGTFAGAYPLMYFAQEYISLGTAVLGSAALVLAMIAVRALTLMGLRLAMVGVVLPAAAIMALTLVAAIWPYLQGLLLTVEALGFFIVAMLLIPRLPATALAPIAPATASLPSAPLTPTEPTN